MNSSPAKYLSIKASSVSAIASNSRFLTSLTSTSAGIGVSTHSFPSNTLPTISTTFTKPLNSSFSPIGIQKGAIFLPNFSFSSVKSFV